MSNYKSATLTTRITTKSSASPSPSPAATNNNNSRSNGNQACAACKYQRRKCAPDCILAPYFPHHRQRQFLNAHKLFGVSNITKIIRYLDQPHKDQAMRTIIFQSDVRAHDPVGGCYRIIRDLQRQIEYNRMELQLVLHQLAICKAQNQQQPQHLHQAMLVGSLDHQHEALSDDNVNNNINCNVRDPTLNGMDSFDVISNFYDEHQHYQQHHHQNYLFQNDYDDDAAHYSWGAMQNSSLTTELEGKQSCAVVESCPEEDHAKPLLDDVRGGGDDQIQEFKFQLDDKTMENVHKHLRLKTPAQLIN